MPVKTAVASAEEPEKPKRPPMPKLPDGTTTTWPWVDVSITVTEGTRWWPGTDRSTGTFRPAVGGPNRESFYD